jgi:hypothetical protein
VDPELGQQSSVQSEPGGQRPGHGHHQLRLQQLQIPVIECEGAPAGLTALFSVIYISDYIYVRF